MLPDRFRPEGGSVLWFDGHDRRPVSCWRSSVVV